MKTKLYIGIDIGGTKISSGLINDKGRVLTRQKISTPHAASRPKTIRAIIDIIEQTMAEAGKIHSDISGIGIGIPGLVDARKGKVIITPNMHLSGVNIAKEIRAKFKTPVKIGNDVNLGLLGEKWLGCAKGKENAVCLFLGTGIGGGIIAENKLITGAHGAAAEIGHMIINLGGPKCT